jgi:deoxyuridine 5'-triphosphate nucleotidohydrolase
MKKQTFLGKNNPNYRHEYDRSYFKDIDTKLKAYVLGWIASDGNIKQDTICVSLHNRDRYVLQSIVEKTNGLFTYRNNILKAQIKVFSVEIVQDICSHLKITPGKKDRVVEFPDLRSDELKWAFLRGYFDGDGSIKHPGGKKSYPQCNITSMSTKMLDSIEKFCNIPCNNDKKSRIEWYGNNAIDFLGKLYDNATIYLTRKKDLYTQIAMWVPSITSGKGIRGNNNNVFYWSKVKDNAVPPYKAHASDSGFDLTLIEKIKQVGEIEYYSTGIKIRPAFGWYFDMVPRSSMPKTGYCLANDIGVIDRTYTGPIIAALRKFDKTSKDLELPARIVQIIPRPIIHPEIILVDDFEETTRKSGGFGSTGV